MCEEKMLASLRPGARTSFTRLHLTFIYLETRKPAKRGKKIQFGCDAFSILLYII